MNSVNLTGRLTKDPVTRYTAGDKPLAIANFTLAIQDPYNVEKCDFVPCKAFGKVAELIEKYCHKGEMLGITGKLQSGSYEKEGKKVYTLDAIANEITLYPKAKAEEKQEEKPDDTPSGFTKMDDEDFLPF